MYLLLHWFALPLFLIPFRSSVFSSNCSFILSHSYILLIAFCSLLSSCLFSHILPFPSPIYLYYLLSFSYFSFIVFLFFIFPCYVLMSLIASFSFILSFYPNTVEVSSLFLLVLIYLLFCFHFSHIFPASSELLFPFFPSLHLLTHPVDSSSRSIPFFQVLDEKKIPSLSSPAPSLSLCLSS